MAVGTLKDSDTGLARCRAVGESEKTGDDCQHAADPLEPMAVEHTA